MNSSSRSIGHAANTLTLTRRTVVAGAAATLLGACSPDTPSRATEGRVAVPGGSVVWRRFGDGPRTPLLMVHGGPGFPSDYMEGFGALGDERPVFMWDQLGCGRSDRPADVSLWTLERFVAELDAVRQSLAPGSVHVLGHSWGSSLLMEWLVTTRPANVASVIFAGPCLSVPRYNADAKQLVATLSQDSQAAIAEAERSGDYQSAAFQAAYNGEFMGRYVSRTPNWATLDVIQRTGAGMNPAIYGLMWGPSDLECTGTLKEFDRTPELASLTLPALFHAAEFDETRPETAREHAALAPNAEFVMIPNSGHLTMIDAPNAANRAIREFLARIERA